MFWDKSNWQPLCKKCHDKKTMTEDRYEEIGPTELIVLETKNPHMDYTFLMEDDIYIHFEFQTTDKGVLDLKEKGY